MGWGVLDSMHLTAQPERHMRRLLPEDKMEITIDDGSGADADAISVDNACEIPDEVKGLSEYGIDVQCGVKNSGTVEDFLMLLKLFYDSIDDKQTELNGYCLSEDYDNYTIKIHALKSSARIIGATALGEEAQALEEAGKKGDIAYIKENHEEFMRKYVSLKEPVSKCFAVDEQTESDNAGHKDKVEADETLIREVFAEIRAAAEAMDIDGIEDIYSEMDGYLIPEKYKEKYEAIKTAATEYDYDAIKAVLDNIR